MKNLKIFLLLTFVVFSSCDLDEEPPYLDDTAYTNIDSVLGTLNGIYAGLASYNAQEQRLFVLNGFSGFFNTRRQGGNTNNVNNRNLFLRVSGPGCDPWTIETCALDHTGS